MQLTTASRKKVKIKCALQGPSGSGKTKSALYIAYGLCGAWDKIAVIDTENRSSELYSDVGNFKVLHLEPPFSPERYTQAIGVCIQAGIEAVIIDSLTHEWEAILDIHSKMTGNSFTNWSKVTPRHNAFVNAMLQADVHILGTIRAKQDYVLSDKNGKMVPEKVGLKGVQREGMDYEFTIVFDLDTNLQARVSKDRTQLFYGKPDFIPTVETGKKILEWCNEGKEVSQTDLIKSIMQQINSCTTLEQLNQLYNSYPGMQQSLQNEFTQRKQQILLQQPITNHKNAHQNGTYRR